MDAYSFNVVTKNLGNISDWVSNTVSEKDIANLKSEVEDIDDKDPLKANLKEKFKDAATSIIDSEIKKSDDKKPEKINIFLNDLVNQITSKDNFINLFNLMKNKQKTNDITYAQIGINTVTVGDITIDVSNIITPTNFSVNDIVEKFLEKKYSKIQSLAGKSLADSGHVFLLTEFNTKVHAKSIMHLERPETIAISYKDNYDYEFHFCNETKKNPDTVIAIPKNLFDNIKNQSFEVKEDPKNNVGTDVACVTATHKNSNKKCMFIAAHITGFKKEEYSKWEEQYLKTNQGLQEAQQIHKKKWGMAVELADKKGRIETFGLNTKLNTLNDQLTVLNNQLTDLKSKSEKNKGKFILERINEIKSEIGIIELCKNSLTAKKEVEGVEVGDKELLVIADKVKQFKKKNPNGIVIFGGDLNTNQILYKGRHDILENEQFTVKGSGKPTNIQEGKYKNELDFIGLTTKNHYSKKTIANIAIKTEETPNEFNYNEEPSDHLKVVAEITIYKTVPKIQRLFNKGLSLFKKNALSLLSKSSQKITKNVTHKNNPSTPKKI